VRELTGTPKAAALHGVAINSGYPQADRLRAAIQALDIYEQEYDALVAERDRLRADPAGAYAEGFRDAIALLRKAGLQLRVGDTEETKP
jgi:hypothetical protein